MKLSLVKLTSKFGGLFAAFALVIASFSANTACMWISHQPELPEDVKNLRKF